MKLLMISRDQKIRDQRSAVFSRMKDLSRVFDELHIVVLSFSKNQNIQITSGNLYVYDASSRFFPLAFVLAFFGLLKVSKSFEKTDFITSQDSFETGFMAWLIAKIRRIKLQLQAHTDFLSPHFLEKSYINKARVLFAKLLLPTADSVRVVSQRIKRDIGIAGIKAKCVSVLPVFIDEEAIKNAPVDFDLREKFQNKKVILIVSRLEKEKNVSLALHTFQKFHTSCLESVLVIAGEGSLKATLAAEAKRLGVQDSIHFLGFIKNVASLYKTSNVLLVTSNYEGYGLNMMEAAICNLPIVATNVGVAEEIDALIGDDEESLAKQISKALSITNKGGYASNLLTKEVYLQAYKAGFL